MKVYCAGPIRGDLTYQESFKKIIEFTENLGHSVLTEFSVESKSTIPLTDKQIYKRDLKWIDDSQCMIAEISGPSLGVGFEISYAIFKKEIPVLAIYNSEVPKISAMILGCDSPLLVIQKYHNKEEMKQLIKRFISKHSSK